MHYCIHFNRDEDEICHVMTNETKTGIGGKVGKVVGISGDKIIHPDNLVSFF